MSTSHCASIVYGMVLDAEVTARMYQEFQDVEDALACLGASRLGTWTADSTDVIVGCEVVVLRDFTRGGYFLPLDRVLPEPNAATLAALARVREYIGKPTPMQHYLVGHTY